MIPRPPNRTHIVQMSDEARALKELRLQRRLSMRQAAKLFGWSSGYISHLENGRVKILMGSGLEKILSGYGTTLKSFQERVRKIRKQREIKPDRDLFELIPRLNREDAKIIKELTHRLLNAASQT